MPTTLELPTTHRVYEQGATSTCCAHAVAAAMETRMVAVNALDPLETPIDAFRIFAQADSQMSLDMSCAAVRDGIATPYGMEKATTQRIPGDPAIMVFELQQKVPLMIEIDVGTNFLHFDGRSIYRSEGSRARHAVCVIGYGTEDTTQESYWIIKNSYGPQWGFNGCALIRWHDDLVMPESNVFAMMSVDP